LRPLTVWLHIYLFIYVLTATCAAQDGLDLLTRSAQVEGTAAAHYLRIAMYMAPGQAETVVDEVWRDGEGRWRLERTSDSWDNGLVAVNDGRSLVISSPYLPVYLQVPAHVRLFGGTLRSLINPGLFSASPESGAFQVHGEDTVLGKPAIMFISRMTGTEIRRWIDKKTQMPLREELLDLNKKPIAVVIRRDLPGTEVPASAFQLLPAEAKIQTNHREWRQKAIIEWLRAKMPFSIPFRQYPVNQAEIEWVGWHQTTTGPAAVLLVRIDGELATMWFSTTGRSKPVVSRPLLAGGRIVITRSIGSLDVSVVATTERLATRLMRVLLGDR